MSTILEQAQIRRVTVSATNLFAVASVYLGDATQWTRIARANGLVDPWIDGIVELVIPPRGSSSDGGVLG